MKRRICLITLFFIIMSFFSLNVYAQSKSFGWYCVHRSDHKQPICDPTMSFIEKYNGYYIDKNHGDACNDKVVYLTFDAGYENGNVCKILDIMKAEDVKGAFFILAHLVEKETELVRRMADEGHTVCNHTAKHKNMSLIEDPEKFRSELESLEKLYLEKTGYTMSKYYRPPEGKFSELNLKMANDLGYKTVFWSFAYADWDNDHQMSAEAAKNKILSNIHNGAVLLLHPTSSANVNVLGSVIKTLKKEGYRFGTLDELTK